MFEYLITGQIPLSGYDFHLLREDGHDDNCFYYAPGGHCDCGWYENFDSKDPNDLTRDINHIIRAKDKTDALERLGVDKDHWHLLNVKTVDN